MWEKTQKMRKSMRKTGKNYAENCSILKFFFMDPVHCGQNPCKHGRVADADFKMRTWIAFADSPVVHWVSGELYFIAGLVSDGDWAPNDQIGRLDG